MKFLERSRIRMFVVLTNFNSAFLLETTQQYQAILKVQTHVALHFVVCIRKYICLSLCDTGKVHLLKLTGPINALKSTYSCRRRLKNFLFKKLKSIMFAAHVLQCED